jgi:glutathione S-transferase
LHSPSTRFKQKEKDTPMILRSSPPSPFGRKIKIALSVLNMSDKVTVQITDAMSETDTIRQQNPLGKIPCLILEEGQAVFDSRVILEYIDLAAGGGKIIPLEAKQRIEALTLQALADGIMDAGIVQRYETVFRTPEMYNEKWLAYQREKVSRSLAFLEKAPPTWQGVPHVGIITLACALGYQDFRFKGEWRLTHPKLVAWLDDFAARVPSFETTKPPAA